MRNWERLRYRKNGSDWFHQVALGLMCVPAKYSIPGKPNAFGSEVNSCQTNRVMPSVSAWSKVGFRSVARDSLHWGPMLVIPSSAANGLP
jgi:hypothetical protein